MPLVFKALGRIPVSRQFTPLCTSDMGDRYDCGHTVCPPCAAKASKQWSVICAFCAKVNVGGPNMMYPLLEACNVVYSSLRPAAAASVPTDAA